MLSIAVAFHQFSIVSLIYTQNTNSILLQDLKKKENVVNEEMMVDMMNSIESDGA